MVCILTMEKKTFINCLLIDLTWKLRVNNRDNAVHRLLFGEWYKSEWPKRIMEASFVYAGDLKYRPPRKLYVNDVSEGNFFTEGPLKGSAGIYNA